MNIVNVGYKSTNYYAIDIKEGRLLVDCGWPGTLPEFTASMKRKGISPQDIKYILPTHFHPDHAGLVQEFKDQGSKLIVLENQVGFIKPLAGLIKTNEVQYTHIREHDNLLLKFSEARAFLAGLGLQGEIIPTPYHSEDSITLILDEGMAFTGDLPPLFMIPEDDEIGRKCWGDIHTRNVTKIFPGHGR